MMKTFLCPTCGQHRVESERVSTDRLRRVVVDRLRAEHPEWDGLATCRADAHRCRIELFRELVQAQRGTLRSLDADVLERMEKNQLVARDVENAAPELGARVADRVASFGGSWTFLGLFGTVIVLWMAANVALMGDAFDPYPFILLNLVLSCLAAVQAPIIMMSQNRHAAKDRERAEHDYEVNLKAELEVQLLHEKLDHLIFREWQSLLELQALQIEMLEDLTERASARK